VSTRWPSEVAEWKSPLWAMPTSLLGRTVPSLGSGTRLRGSSSPVAPSAKLGPLRRDRPGALALLTDRGNDCGGADDAGKHGSGM